MRKNDENLFMGILNTLTILLSGFLVIALIRHFTDFYFATLDYVLESNTLMLLGILSTIVVLLLAVSIPQPPDKVRYKLITLTHTYVIQHEGVMNFFRIAVLCLGSAYLLITPNSTPTSYVKVVNTIIEAESETDPYGYAKQQIRQVVAARNSNYASFLRLIVDIFYKSYHDTNDCTAYNPIRDKITEMKTQLSGFRDRYGTDPLYKFGKAKLYSYERDYADQAIRLYNELIRDTDPRIYTKFKLASKLNLGKVYLDTNKDLAKAIEIYQEIQPELLARNRISGWTNLIASQITAGKYADARKTTACAIQWVDNTFPDTKSTKNHYAYLLVYAAFLTLQDPSSTSHDFKQAVKQIESANQIKRDIYNQEYLFIGLLHLDPRDEAEYRLNEFLNKNVDEKCPKRCANLLMFFIHDKTERKKSALLAYLGITDAISNLNNGVIKQKVHDRLKNDFTACADIPRLTHLSKELETFQ